MYYNIDEIKLYMENFGLNEDDAFTEEDVDNFICTMNKNVPPFDYDSGATKLVIIPEDREYVIKIPFNGDYKDDDFFSFECGGGEWFDNYCATEEGLYIEAYNEDFGDVFLPIEEVFTVNNYPIYVQPKAEIFIDLSSDEIESYSSEKSKKEISENRRSIDIFNAPSAWIASCLDALGSIEKLKEFSDFLWEQGINDLHRGNLGFYKGKAVIVDYGGYCE